jgi:hypothetical protein
MMFLRLLSLLAGGLVLMVPPIMMFDGTTRGMPAWMAIAGLLVIALSAICFFYIAATGKQMRRSPGQARTLGGMLLTAPLFASLALLATRTDPVQLCATGVLLAFTILLAMSFVFAPTMGRRQRPMRERERHAATILQLRRR